VPLPMALLVKLDRLAEALHLTWRPSALRKFAIGSMRPLIASGDALPRYGGREAHGRSCLDLARTGPEREA
jgi:hypothetical protein